MECASENELVEFADGLLDAERARTVGDHLDACTTCRGIVAELARATETAIDPVASSASERMPEDLLRTYMARDARSREISASRLVIALLVLGIAAQLATAFGLRTTPTSAMSIGAGILGLFLVYEVIIHIVMRRGWFHPVIPLVSTCLEASIGSAMGLASATVSAADVVTTPWLVFEGAYLVFVAIRADARLPIIAGVLLAAEQIGLYLLVADRLEHTPVAFTAVGACMRAGLFLACGAGGAIVARHFVRRATEALAEIREQDMLGRYLLRERLGRGGMGEVYRATYCPEGGFVRQVALKKLRAERIANPRFVEAFRAEARLASTLAHPNLVQVIDCGHFRGDFVFVMEYVDGIALADLVRNAEPLEPCAVAYLGIEIASALAYLHAHWDSEGEPIELVHCDVNPPNVLVSRIGEVKLADFGVMRATTPTSDGTVGFGGKLSYAAPEQLMGAPLDGRADLFALGLTLREALVASHVFTSARTALTDEVPPLPPEVPAPLRAIVEALVARDPQQRPSAIQVRASLESLAGALAPIPTGRAALVRRVADALTGRPTPRATDRAEREAVRVSNVGTQAAKTKKEIP